MIVLFLFLAFFQTAPPVQKAITAPLREGCSADDDQIGTVSEADRVEVRQAIAGGDGACYRIDVTRDGKTVSGYVTGNALPAIAAFEQQRERTIGSSLEAIAQQAAPAPAPAKPEVDEAPVPAGIPQVFENFSGHDLKGNFVSLSSLRGRVILVTFWSSRGASKHALMSILPLYNQFKHRGLMAIGVGTGIGSHGLAEVLDDITLPWPQVPDPGGLAQRYGVDPRQGRTFVLDSSHRIVASAVNGSALEHKIRQMLE